MAAPQIVETQEPKSNTMFPNYYMRMVSQCKLRMVGKFLTVPKPKMTKIRVSFKAKIPLKGVVKIKSYDSLHVFLDFKNEEDYECVLSKEKVVVAGAVMEVFRWAPQFHDQFRETFGIPELDNTKRDEPIGGGNEYGTKESEAVPKNSHIRKDVLYISDLVDCVPEVTHSDSEDTVASFINCETSERHFPWEISCSGTSGLSSAPYGIVRILSITHGSSSMYSTDSVPLRGTCLNNNNQESYSRGWNYGSKSTGEPADSARETRSQPLYAFPIVERHESRNSRPPIEVHYSTSMGYPTVTFSENYCESLVPNYKLTLIGSFSHRRPKMKEIRVDFRAKIPLNGQVKIRSGTCRQVLFLFTNEEDYYTVLYKKTFVVAGALMQISWSSPDSHHVVKQNIHPDFRTSDANPFNWGTDTSKLHPYINGLSAAQSMIAGRSPYDATDYSSSMCSTYSVNPVVTDWPYEVTSLNHKNQQPPSREWNHRSKSTSDISVSCEETRSNSQAIALSSLEQQVLKKEVVVSRQSELTEADRERPALEMPNVSFPPRSPPRSIGSAIQAMSKLKVSNGPNSVNRSISDSSKLTQRSVTLVNSAETAVLLNADPHKGIKPKAMEKPLVQSGSITTKNFQSRQVTAPATDEKPMSLQLAAMSQCLSAPSLHPPLPLLAHSESVAGRLCTDPLTSTGTCVSQFYNKGVVGNPIFGRNKQAGRGSTFPSLSQALDQHSLAQQHNQLNSYKESNMTARIAQLQLPSTTSVSDTTSTIRYRECLKNHAASMGGHAVDGCGEFMPSGEKGTPGALKCAACNCHQNFHRKEIDNHQQMAGVESHSTFSQPRNNNSSGGIQNQALISLPTRQQQYHHKDSNSYSPRSVVNSSQSYPQTPSPISGLVFSQQDLERIEPSFIRPSYSYEMVDHDTMHNGQQREYSWRDSSRNTSQNHPSTQNENCNFDMFKPLNNRTPDQIPLEFPACPSRCQSLSVFADEFPHLDVINNLLDEEDELDGL